MLVIVSKIISEFWLNLKTASAYNKIVIPANLIFILIIFTFLRLSTFEYLILLASGLILQLVALNYIGNYRRTEMKELKAILKKITNDKLESPDEIKLRKSLEEIENRLKSMFARTQQDITNLKKLEQIRTEFLGNVSHELRTPIFAIQGYLETLLDGAMDDPTVNKNFVIKANNHTKNLNNLLNDLIDISMIESGQMIMSFRNFNVHDFLEKIILMYKPMAAKKGLNLILTCKNKELQLYGDTDRLNQVMINLIQNAIKYTESGNVELKVESTSKYGVISVIDSGIGIGENDIERIFERFYRVDKGRSKAVGGTGLGLAIVKHIVDAHSSQIRVMSKLGSGTEFSFRLRKYKPDEAN